MTPIIINFVVDLKLIIYMATIEFRLSSKVNPEGRQEIMIRLFHGKKFNLRSKSRIFVDPSFFEYYVNRDATFKNYGVEIPFKVITARKDEAEKNGWDWYDRGIIVINSRVQTPEVKEARKAEKKLSLLKTFITDSLQNANIDNVDSKWLKSIVDLFHDGEKIDKEKEAKRGLLNRFKQMIEGNELLTKNGTPITEGRRAHYRVMYGILFRYLTINDKTEIKIEDVDKDFLLDLRDFIINENVFVEDKKWKHLYKGMKVNNIPSEPRSLNTASMKMKVLQTFFKIIFANGEIEVNPFDRFTQAQHAGLFKGEDKEPFSLELSELKAIINKDVPKHLQPIKDAFLVQCALGCRVSDFAKMGMPNIVVADNVPFVEYASQKTGMPTKTPIVPFALHIIKDNDFKFPILRNVNGSYGYNKLIKSLLKECGINREIVTGKKEGRLVKSPLWQLASSKLPRKVNVTLTTKIQLHTSVAGLHKEGSSAIGNYLALSDSDRYLLMCRAFGEEPVKVGKDLRIIGKM